MSSEQHAAAAGVDENEDEKKAHLRCIHTCTTHGSFTRRAYASAHNRHAKLHTMCVEDCPGFPHVQLYHVAAAVDAAYEQAQLEMHHARQRAWIEQAAMLSPMIQWGIPPTPAAPAVTAAPASEQNQASDQTDAAAADMKVKQEEPEWTRSLSLFFKEMRLSDEMVSNIRAVLTAEVGDVADQDVKWLNYLDDDVLKKAGLSTLQRLRWHRLVKEKMFGL